MSVFGSATIGGTINGTNTVFTVTLNTSSITGFEMYKNGVLLGTNDFGFTQTLGTATITTSTPPASGDTLAGWIFQQ